MTDLRRCLECGKELSTSKFSTESMRTDGYCTAKCKRQAKWKEMREEKAREYTKFRESQGDS